MSVTIDEPLHITLEGKEVNRLLQTPSGRHQPLQMFGVGRTVEVEGGTWVVTKQDPEGSRTRLKSVTGRVGHPVYKWVWNQTQVEE